MSWTKISEVEAKSHRLYGVNGWLLLFAILMPFSVLLNFGFLRGEAWTAGVTVSALLSLDHPAVTFIKLSLGLQIVYCVVMLSLLITKSAAFRQITSWSLLAYYPLIVLASLGNPFEGQGQGLAQAALQWVFSCVVWITYLQRSRRVRVTFEHRVLTTELGGAVATADSKMPSESPAALVSQGTPTRKDRASPDTAMASHTLFGAADNPDEQYWEQAFKEVEGSDRRAGLWARAFAHAKGVEAVAKAKYLEERAKELAKEDQARLAEEARIHEVQLEEAKIAALPEECRAYERLPKGRCPNCGALQPIGTAECHSCTADFGPGAVWSLIPVGTKLPTSTDR